jgi:type II secretory pathway pseudopilin PulG
MKNSQAFTMAEITVVVLIVGLLTAAAVPLLSGWIDASRWSQAKATMDTIASALQSYAAEKGDFVRTPTFAQIGISASDLDGTYFSHQAYAITSASASDGRVSFVITCRAVANVRRGKPLSPAAMTLTCGPATNYVPTFTEGRGV